MGLTKQQNLIPAAFYQTDNVVHLAQKLIGCTVHTYVDDEHCAAKITETEAYRGWGDKACHAHLNRRTKRTEIMYAKGGVAYVYLCYGIHNLFNIVTNKQDSADAILIRAGEPLTGINVMLQRRNQTEVNSKLLAGPGNFTKGMGISAKHYGADLQNPPIWLEFSDEKQPALIATPRVGIDYAEEDKDLPWRFYPKNSPYISKK